MIKHLLIAVLGKGNSGKSTTWNTLFGRTVRTGNKKFYLNRAQWVNVFLIYSSSEERKISIKKILQWKVPTIVFCSVQYIPNARDSFDFFFSRGYEVFVQWLNPGYRDRNTYGDNLNLQEYLIKKGAFISKRNGKLHPKRRVSEIRKIILGWSVYHNLIRTDF